MIEIAKQILQDFPVEWRRFFFVSKQTQTFDLICASYILSEIQEAEERETMLLNMWKCLKEGGVLVTFENFSSFIYIKLHYSNKRWLLNQELQKDLN